MILTKVKNSKLPTKSVDAVRALYISDVHLLHSRTPTHVIIENLRRMFTPELLTSIDVLYILGDLWDDSRHLRQENTQEALDFIVELIQMAKLYNFGLRVLEGTPSHDHNQSKVILSMNKAIGADVVYLDEIGIFHDKRLNMNVGYVKDEYKHTAVETEREMREIMKTRGLSQVDFFAMHGCFTFQLPVFKPESFNEKFWCPRAKYGIFIGHDHRPKLNGKIRVTGTPDRLSHGEEEDKGITVVDYVNDQAHAYFIVNEYACPYIKVSGHENDDDLYKACLQALKYVDEHPTGDYGRLKIVHRHDSGIPESIRRWSKEYRFIIQGEKLPDPDKEMQLELAFEEDKTAETITKDNVHELLFEELSGESFDKTIAMEILDEVA
tara:strand:- start:25675 stop:26817 length:1143 start_codon:yes stop_codon:yes gene_type:complete